MQKVIANLRAKREPAAVEQTRARGVCARLNVHTALLATALALSASAPALAGADSARSIMERATEAAGGDAWLLARTNLMTGNATLYRGGRAMRADRYEMRRVYPVDLEAAHTNTGKFRLDSYSGENLMFSIGFDGTQMYDPGGPMPPEQAAELAASSFGFSAVRFALQEGFELQRLADDEIAGRPCYFVQIVDPAGGSTLVGIDTRAYLIRYVGWQTPRGWHHRVYTDYYRLDSGFMQPGRVRLYYDGVKTTDINWTSAILNTELPDDIFRLGHPAPAKK